MSPETGLSHVTVVRRALRVERFHLCRNRLPCPSRLLLTSHAVRVSTVTEHR